MIENSNLSEKMRGLVIIYFESTKSIAYAVNDDTYEQLPSSTLRSAYAEFKKSTSEDPKTQIVAFLKPIRDYLEENAALRHEGIVLWKVALISLIVLIGVAAVYFVFIRKQNEENSNEHELLESRKNVLRP